MSLLYEEFQNIQRNFFCYLTSFHQLNDPNKQYHINLKEEHSIRVSNIMKELSQYLQLDEAAQIISQIIGLLHDTGRFYQYNKYNTFNDTISINHAQLGIKIIEEKGWLRFLPIESQNIIKTAIFTHNLRSIPLFPPSQTLFYQKLIRDADKLDIFHFITQIYEEKQKCDSSPFNFEFKDEDSINPKILSQFLKEVPIFYSQANSITDFKILKLSWIYDVNFSISLKILHEKGYLKRIIKTIPILDVQKILLAHIDEWIQKKIQESSKSSQFRKVKVFLH